MAKNQDIDLHDLLRIIEDIQNNEFDEAKELFAKYQDTTPEYDGVDLIVLRHDSAVGEDIDAKGAADAYVLGKFMHEVYAMAPADCIMRSPSTRSRHTGDMHAIAIEKNTGKKPIRIISPGFHETASKEVFEQTMKNAIEFAKANGLRTLEIVGHQPTIGQAAEYFNTDSKSEKIVADSVSTGYGGGFTISATDWDAMANKDFFSVNRIQSSNNFKREVYGQEQYLLAELLLNPERGLDRIKDNNKLTSYLKANLPKEIISFEGEIRYDNPAKILPYLLQRQRQEGQAWAINALMGQEVESNISPEEYLENYDAYKFWITNKAFAAGCIPLNKDQILNNGTYPSYQRGQKERVDDPLYSELQRWALGDTAQGFADKYLINEDRFDSARHDADTTPYSYPILDAKIKRLQRAEGKTNLAYELGKEVVDDGFDGRFPGYAMAHQVGKEYEIFNGELKEYKGGNIGRVVIRDDELTGESHKAYNAMMYKMAKEGKLK